MGTISSSPGKVVGGGQVEDTFTKDLFVLGINADSCPKNNNNNNAEDTKVTGRININARGDDPFHIIGVITAVERQDECDEENGFGGFDCDFPCITGSTRVTGSYTSKDKDNSGDGIFAACFESGDTQDFEAMSFAGLSGPIGGKTIFGELIKGEIKEFECKN